MRPQPILARFQSLSIHVRALSAGFSTRKMNNMTNTSTGVHAVACHADVAGCVKLAVSIREAATMIGVSPRSIQNFIRLKRLPARKIGRRTVILVRALEVFLRNDHESPTFSCESGVQP
jgi:hypothetical protein